MADEEKRAGELFEVLAEKFALQERVLFAQM